MLTIGNKQWPDFPLVLSPMYDITDKPFRSLCRHLGADVTVTEFIAAEALVRDAEKSLRKLLFDEETRPVGIQIFGANEEELLRCVDIVKEHHPDFIDINWGCPVRKVAGRGAGSGMLLTPDKLVAITAALVRRAEPYPITVKTRLGYDANNKPICELAERLQDIGIAALAIHGRTKTQMYTGQADWTLIGRVKENPRMRIPVFGNGDITHPSEPAEMQRRYGVDGVLIGRAAIGNPWIFEQSRAVLNGHKPRTIMVSERCEVCKRHLQEAIHFKGERVAVLEMRKHYSGYFRALHNFKPFRQQLVTLTTADEVMQLLDSIALHYEEHSSIV